MVKKVSAKFGIYKFLVFSAILAHSSSSSVSNYADRNF